ncbi:MAG: UDP-N-acetylglucosamine 1-carboxyvinyltransferase [Clostridia bacterium]|nr:UDP-N-acetylglucosamine 1-carboxyvinyltransferase [Clostridia bacterium]
MSKILVRSGGKLCGKVKISGSKNSALPILAATVLSEGESKILQVPNLSDIWVMCSLLESIGAEIGSDKGEIIISWEHIKSDVAPYELVSKMRGSFLLAGPLLARCGHTRISLPGGCPIGTRPVDLHLKGFAAMGADIAQGHGYIDISAEKLHGAKIYLDFPSVGATENIMMAACLADGETIIENVAAEPEIIDLAGFLNKMGAKITGAGSDTIKIEGVKSLKGIKHKVIPDRIEAGSFMAGIAITGGHALIENVIPSHIKPITAKLREMGVEIKEEKNFIEMDAGGQLNAADIKTLPFPGFPTDMQAPFTALMSVVEGTSVIVETVFENRFLHVAELSRMGAKIKIDGRTEVVEGGFPLTGAQVKATDLRGGAALVLAGLVAKGDTEIGDIEHIDRGYEDIVGKLQGLGADIQRI